MNPLQNCKFVPTLAPVSDADAFTTIEVDCVGYHYATVVLLSGLIGAADFTVCKIQGGNVTGTVADLTNDTVRWVADVATATTGFNFITSGSTPGDTTDGKVWVAHIDLRRGDYSGLSGSGLRFIQLQATAAATSLFAGVVILSDPDVGPTNNTQWNTQATIIG